MELMRTIEGMDREALLRLRDELRTGRLLEKVEERISALENPNRVCPVCGAAVDPAEAITLTFGPKGLRQRASFDAEDCLRHFTRNSKV